MPQIDWNSVLDGIDDEDTPLPKDDYEVKVTKAEATTASTGAAMINVQMQVVGGPHAGRVLFTNLVFKTDNPNAMKMTLRKLKALGVTREWILESGAQTEQIATAIVGKVALAAVDQREWQGEMRNEVGMFKSSGPVVPSAPKPTVSSPSISPVPDPPTITPPTPLDEEEPF